MGKSADLPLSEVGGSSKPGVTARFYDHSLYLYRLGQLTTLVAVVELGPGFVDRVKEHRTFHSTKKHSPHYH